MKKWLFSLAGAALLAVPGAAQAQNREVVIHNLDPVTIYYVYATNAGVQGWGEDWLGSEVIIEDERMRFNFDDGSGACIFDIRVKYSDDTISELFDVNVCEVSHIDATRSRLVVNHD